MVELQSTKLFIPALRPKLAPRLRPIQRIHDGLHDFSMKN
jgi:hypothetical protein